MQRFAASALGRLGVRYPIIQAPMAGTSTPALAAAVTNAGGLGSLGIGASRAEVAREAIQQTQRLTSGPFNVNVFVHRSSPRDSRRETAWLQFLRPRFEAVGANPPTELKELYRSFNDDPAVLQILLETKPPVVSFHFGLPSKEAIEQLRAYGAVLLASATSLEEGLAIQAAGIDGVIAQGIEAGGHRGVFDPEAKDESLSTAVLVRLLAKHLDIPVIAAGAIMDGEGVAAYLALGATACQLGTAFVACPESAADQGYRSALLKQPAAGGGQTRLTSLISGRPARCLKNAFTDLAEELDATGGKQPGYPAAYDAGKALHAAAKAKGEHGYGAHWAGMGAAMARPMPAKDLVQTLVKEMEETLSHSRLTAVTTASMFQL